MPLDLLPVPPVIEFHNHRAIANAEVLREVVVCEYDEQVRCRLVSPLEPEVEINVIGLLVVLQESGHEKLIRHGEVYTRSDKKEVDASPGFR